MSTNRHSLFVSHGGGPLPLLNDEGHKEMVACLQKIANTVEKPSALVVISAHWEEDQPTVTSSISPELIYDYYGFPDESYDIQYPCPGEPNLANQIHSLLNKAGYMAKLDDRRGLDHGVFVPLKIMYPQADIPCVQLSLLNSLDPAEHINLGKVLGSLEYDNCMIMGSGFSFHNMKAFFIDNTRETINWNESFENWLVETCTSGEMDETEREQTLINWAEAPHAGYCHPREEHLLPLHVCYGFAQAKCSTFYRLSILNKKASMYLW